jgi:hypothetical protein
VATRFSIAGLLQPIILKPAVKRGAPDAQHLRGKAPIAACLFERAADSELFHLLQRNDGTGWRRGLGPHSSDGGEAGGAADTGMVCDVGRQIGKMEQISRVEKHHRLPTVHQFADIARPIVISARSRTISHESRGATKAWGPVLLFVVRGFASNLKGPESFTARPQYAETENSLNAAVMAPGSGRPFHCFQAIRADIQRRRLQLNLESAWVLPIRKQWRRQWPRNPGW